MTAGSLDGSLHFSHAAVGSMGITHGEVTPTPTPDDQDIQGDVTSGGSDTVTGRDMSSGVAGELGSATGGSDIVGTGTAGSGGGGGGGGGSLPFTGLAVGPLATLGAALVGTGAALRRLVGKS